eukprot:GHVT01083554.1.p1 GENE.GHVT01083554.1~~GHVT01083554.1.p1  ORF type:complete len:119 (+),score=29.66 GHVT01083554.1:576-932(+)
MGVEVCTLLREAEMLQDVELRELLKSHCAHRIFETFEDIVETPEWAALEETPPLLTYLLQSSLTKLSESGGRPQPGKKRTGRAPGMTVDEEEEIAGAEEGKAPPKQPAKPKGRKRTRR